jgi:hypothetical protein
MAVLVMDGALEPIIIGEDMMRAQRVAIDFGKAGMWFPKQKVLIPMEGLEAGLPDVRP